MDLLDAHGRAMDVFDRAMNKLGTAELDSPTPCVDWTVRDLVNHLVVEQLWLPDLLAGKTMTEVGDRYDGDQLGDDPVGRWRAASQAARAAWLEPGTVDRTVHLSYGTENAAEYGWQLTTDLAVHGWDLATALGAEAVLGDELATALLDYTEPRMDNWSGSSMFADPVPVPAGTDPQTRLIANLGRRP